MADEEQKKPDEATQAEQADGKSEDELLNEWLDMAGDEDGDGEGEGSGEEDRILDQDEIDSLIGGKSSGGSKQTGIEALLESNVISYERLPLLEVVFDRFERLMSTAMRQFTADNVEISVENITSVRYSEYMNSVPLPAGLVVVKAAGLDDYILTVYESRLIYSVVDILLGGRKSRPAKVEGRNFTTIERKMVEKLSEVVLQGLTEAFSPIAPIKFEFERMEINPRFATITRPGNACILITVRVNLEERDGMMQFCLPYATLEPVRDQLLQQFMGEKFGQDNIWENHLTQELYHTESAMRVVLDEVEMSLAEVSKWRLGDTILFDAREGDPVTLYFGDKMKMVGRVGRAGENVAVKITRSISDLNNMREEG